MTQGPSMGSVFVSTINFHSFVKILTISILKKKKKANSNAKFDHF